jgi:hypothetical protein
MSSKDSLSNKIENNVSEKNFNDINLNSNSISHSSNANSIFLSITHNTQIINNNTNNNVNINTEDSFLNLFDSIKKSKLDYKQFYYEVKKLVMEESSSENENENEIYMVLYKVKEMTKTIKQLKKNENKNMENKLGENTDQENDLKNKATKMIKIDNIKKDKKLGINNYSYNCAMNDYLPELLSPKDNYKAFINSIKQFEYEEKIYDKYITNEDLEILKSFPEKLFKYLGHLKAFKIKKKLNI